MIAIGSHASAKSDGTWFGTYSSVSVMNLRSVIADKTALHARFRICGKHLGATGSVDIIFDYLNSPDSLLNPAEWDFSTAKLTLQCSHKSVIVRGIIQCDPANLQSNRIKKTKTANEDI